MLQFILVYASLLILAAFICNGWYSITRGWWDVQPDGKKVWKGKIFNKFHYWLQRHMIELIPYSNEEWLKVFFQLKAFFKETDILSIGENWVLVKNMNEKNTTLFFAYAASKGIKVKIDIMEGENKERNMMIAAYKPVNKYLLPDLIRYPLGECLSCMSSVYGSLIWFIWVAIIFNVEKVHSSAASGIFVSLSVISHIALWVFFCLILSHLNEIIFNINHKLSK